jgi:hypothetical protein
MTEHSGRARAISRRARSVGVGAALAIVATAGIVAVPVASAQAAPSAGSGTLTNPGPTPEALTPSPGSAKTTAQIQALKAKILPTYSSSVVAGQNGDTYGFTILGGDPHKAKSTTLKTIIVPIKVTFTGTGDVYDPTTTSCSETQTAETGMLKGPMFSKSKFSAGSIKLGNLQYLDAQMRGEFWNLSGFAAKYNTKLKGSSIATYSVSVTGYPEYDPGTCQELGEIDYSAWNSFLQGTVFPALASSGVSPATLPIFLVKNVVFTSGGCCILGYHSAFNNPSFSNNPQVYGIADWDTTGDFGSAAANDAVPSHEIAEAANDPFVNNATPSWGHIGQVTGCQGNLEVGDPLTGTAFTDTIGGVAYTLQELAYFGWFFDQPFGVNSWYSTKGTFTSGATLCS